MPSIFGRAVITALSQSGFQGARSTYIEQSACFVTAAYFDINGVPFIPTAVTYEITDELSAAVILPATPITPALVNQVTISSAQNALISLTRLYEVHEVLFSITDGNADVALARVKFDLLRVVGL